MKWQTLTPTESTRLNRLSQVTTSSTSTPVPNLLQIRPRGASVQMVKYNEDFIYLDFFGNISQDGFSHVIARKMKNHTRCAFAM